MKGKPPAKPTIKDLRLISKRLKEEFKTPKFRSLKLINAAGGLVKNGKGEYLFIFRNGRWDLPKGKLEKKELIKECAVREIEEECGISNLQIVHRLPPTFHIYELNGTMAIKHSHWFLMNYKGTKTLKPQKEEGIKKAVWVKKAIISRLKKNMFPSIIGLLESIEIT